MTGHTTVSLGYDSNIIIAFCESSKQVQSQKKKKKKKLIAQFSKINQLIPPNFKVFKYKFVLQFHIQFSN